MATAYVLLNTEIGAESAVLRALKKIEGVQDAHRLWGVYDVIVHVNAQNVEKLQAIITKQIGKVGQITSKLTMMINEEPPILQEQVVFETAPLIC